MHERPDADAEPELQPGDRDPVVALVDRAITARRAAEERTSELEADLAEQGRILEQIARGDPVEPILESLCRIFEARYAGYVERQREEIERQRRLEDTVLPSWLDFAGVRGLSNEVRQRLLEHRPTTLGQASRIPGVTPAAISLLLVHLKRGAPADKGARRAG